MMMGINTRPKHSWVIFAGLLVLMACSGGNEAETGSADRSSAADETVSSPAPAAEVAPDTVTEPKSQVATPATEDVGPAESAAVTDEHASTAESPAVTDETASPTPVEEESEDVAASEEPEPPAESGPVVVADTKAGLTRIGATKCKMCHRVQYASWAESAHAELDPVLDCESCHGSGSEYKKKSIMEDPGLARAAGLVMPDAAFCIRCHGDDWKDEMLSQAHAHKEDGSG